MNKRIGILVLLLLASATETRAQTAAWCAWYDFSTSNCGFHTYAQCQAAISGVGGYCERNYFNRRGAPRPGGRRTRGSR